MVQWRAALALAALVLPLVGCRTLRTSSGRLFGSLGAEVPGHDGCYYRTDGTGVMCKTTPRQHKYDRAAFVDAWTKRWTGAEQIEVERHPHYSLIAPEVRSLSDGSEMWTYREGGDCEIQETASSKFARSLYASSAARRENRVDCDTTFYGNRATTSCAGPSTPGPPPDRKFQRLCDPEQISQFFLRDGRVVEVRLTFRNK